MDLHNIILDRIDKVLSENNLGFSYDYLHEEDNSLIHPFFASTMDNCKQIGLEFTITTDRLARAGILYEERLIFISFGLFDRLCKLSELIVCSGLIDNSSNTFRYASLDLIDNPFTWPNEKKELFNTPDKNELFLFIFDTLFSFIVAHEIGHYHHKHGERKDDIKINLFDDIIGHREIKENIISSHAREIIADSFAFWNTIEKTKKYIRKKNFRNSYATFLTVFILSSYFQMMDKNKCSFEEHSKSTHPLSIIRTRILFTICMNNDELGINNENFPILLASVSTNIQKLFKIIDVEVLNNFLEETNDENFTKWFKLVHKEFPLWE